MSLILKLQGWEGFQSHSQTWLRMKPQSSWTLETLLQASTALRQKQRCLFGCAQRISRHNTPLPSTPLRAANVAGLHKQQKLKGRLSTHSMRFTGTSCPRLIPRPISFFFFFTDGWSHSTNPGDEKVQDWLFWQWHFRFWLCLEFLSSKKSP